MKINSCIQRTSIATIVLAIVFGSMSMYVRAGSPSGADWFEIITSTQTGGDATGDGGTGNPVDYNYYYVGQSITQQVRIQSDGTDAANIWVDYDTALMNITNLITGTFFPTWAGQVISGGRIKSTGFDLVSTRSGNGNFGSFDVTFTQPTAVSKDTSTPTILDIVTGVIGETTESNISLAGVDLLDDAEDFYLHIWADITKPYAENPSPTDGATGMSIDQSFSFDLRDTLNGEGDVTGVGTGVNVATPPGSIMVDDGGGAVDYTSFDSYLCSGIWGTNHCAVTVNPTSPTSIVGDTRNWEYNTTYTITISGYQDLASSAQDQLGEPNGANTMDTKIWTFTTEADTVAPQVTTETPVRGSTNATTDTDITVTVQDRKSYPNGPSGVGVNSATCRFNISSPSFTLTTFQEGDATVTVTPVNYGYQFTINPTNDFGENEVVSVSAYDCEDIVGNVMTTDTWTFSTGDASAPYVDQINPGNDVVIQPSDTLSFHVKDDGSGVDLSTLVVYVNGVYYSLGGGSVSVTTTGTRITAATSLDLNGGNYVGDTTGITGTPNDYTITIDPQNDFTAGEAVVVLIYAQDADGNLMEREVYGLVVDGVGICADGSTFCGANSLWNGAKCVGTVPPGQGGSSGGGGAGSIALTINSVDVTQINESSVLVTIQTNKDAQGWIAYGATQPQDYGTEPYFGYTFISETSDDISRYHSFRIDNLQTGQLYWFMPLAKIGNEVVRGDAVRMAPVFATNYIEVEKIIREIVEIAGPERIIIRTVTQEGEGESVVEEQWRFGLEFLNGVQIQDQGLGYLIISALQDTITLQGSGLPGDAITIRIY